MKLALPKRETPSKSRLAAMASSPSPAKRVERGKARSASGGGGGHTAASIFGMAMRALVRAMPRLAVRRQTKTAT